MDNTQKSNQAARGPSDLDQYFTMPAGFSIPNANFNDVWNQTGMPAFSSNAVNHDPFPTNSNFFQGNGEHNEGAKAAPNHQTSQPPSSAGVGRGPSDTEVQGKTEDLMMYLCNVVRDETKPEVAKEVMRSMDEFKSKVVPLLIGQVAGEIHKQLPIAVNGHLSTAITSVVQNLLPAALQGQLPRELQSQIGKAVQDALAEYL